MATKTKKEYRDWVRSRAGSIHNSNPTDKHQNKRWRINQNHIRNTIIEEYEWRALNPSFMITRTYYYDQDDRREVEENNDRLNRVIDDFFNPRGRSEYMITKDHFIERHRDKLVRKQEDLRPFRNTITDEYELDYSNVEVKPGSFHVHTLISDISDDVIYRPNSKIRKAIPNIYMLDDIPLSLMQDEEGLERVKMDLLDYALRDRCGFIGNSKSSLDITPQSDYGWFDGYKGWKGMVAYVTKQMYNVDKMIEIYDCRNSTILSN